jgi:multicomponent Na+:H+ antiporter subunit D
MNANLPLVPLLVPFAAALAGLAWRDRLGWQRGCGIAGGALTFLAAALLLRGVGREGYLVTHVGGWQAPVGIVVVADGLSALMVLVCSLMVLAVAVYSVRDVDADRQRAHYFPLLMLLTMGVNGAFLTGDLFNLYVWFEVMLMASFVLLSLGGEKPQLEGAFKYVTINLLASAIFLGAAGLLYAKTGTLNMADLSRILTRSPDAAMINTTAMLFLVAFGLKAGMFPLFFWLPASYHTPPPAVSAIFAGLLTKVGVYALVRAFTLFFNHGADDAQTLLIWLAGLTMVTWVLGAASQFEIRKILSFHIVSQIGYMLMGLALMTQAALAGTVFYLIHHIVVKTNLFLIGGIIEKRKGTGNLARIGGLYLAAPYLALLFLIPALSLGGIPPLSGFWAKFALIRAGLSEGFFWLAGTALAVGLLTLYSMTKIWAEAFWKAQPEPAPEVPAAGTALMAAPAIALAVLTLYLGFFGQPVFELAERAADQLLNPQGYVSAVLGSGQGGQTP